MKKLLAILLAFVLALSLCACGREEPEEPVNENSVTEPSEEEPVEEEPVEEEPAEDIDPKRGTVTDYVYYNEAFGLGFEADENWYFFTDDEIASTMSISAEQMFTEEYAELISDAQIIYDMYATNLVNGSTVNVNYENLGLVYGTIFNEESYLEISKTQLNAQIDGMSGMTLAKCEISSVTVNGTEVPCLEVEIDYGGIMVYEKILVKKTGSWMGAMTLASADPTALESLVAGVRIG